MDRRRVLAMVAGVAAAGILTGHSPYRQWKLYRQSHLLLFTQRDDPRSDELGELLAATLRERLPDSRAQVSRAPNVHRIASLISSGQADVAFLRIEDARALYEGRDAFADYGRVPLRVLVEVEAYHLVCRDDFRGEHAYALVEALTLDPRPADVRVPLPADSDGVPVHAGVLAFARGQPIADR